ncbi:hypothetical protein [Caulobacter sp.]|uniref:hypothetical protein n=1 Tax=Caulobacter sp. TaxID=78 RepID=UPI003BAD2C23
MSVFWRNWMTGWCWAVGVFGVVLAGAGLDVTSGPVRLVFALLQGPEALVLNAQMRFSVALMGAVTIGWSITLMAAIKAAQQLGAAGRSTWVGVIVSVVSWYVIDSSLSIATGFGVNAISNTLFLAAFLLPMARSGVLRSTPATPS